MTTVRAVYVAPTQEGSPKEFSCTIPSFNSNGSKEAIKSLTDALQSLQKDINNHLTLQLKASGGINDAEDVQEEEEEEEEEEDDKPQ